MNVKLLAIIDKNMPIRIMGYDAGTYRQQIKDRDTAVTPVITIVLNMTDKKWDAAKSIHEMLKTDEKLIKYVQNYKINVFDIAFLDDDIIESFTSDFKEIARFFKKKRLGEISNKLFYISFIRHSCAFVFLF